MIIGAGGHGSVVADIAKLCRKQAILFYDDTVEKQNGWFASCFVQGALADLPETFEGIIAIGDNAARKRISERFTGASWRTLVHPGAVVADNVSLGIGTVICAGAIIQPGAVIGDHCLINTAAVVEHGARIGNYAHVASSAIVCGEVIVDEGAFVGAGAVVLPKLEVKAWSTIGAGAVVTSDVPAGKIVFGNPARESVS